MTTRKAAPQYSIVLEGQTYILTIGKTTYRLPQCVCQVHPNECSYGRAVDHPVWKPNRQFGLRAWTVENVRQLADLVARGNVPEPNNPRPLRGRSLSCPPAAKSKKITDDQVKKLQQLCDEAESRGGV